MTAQADLCVGEESEPDVRLLASNNGNDIQAPCCPLSPSPVSQTRRQPQQPGPVTRRFVESARDVVIRRDLGLCGAPAKARIETPPGRDACTALPGSGQKILIFTSDHP